MKNDYTWAKLRKKGEELLNEKFGNMKEWKLKFPFSLVESLSVYYKTCSTLNGWSQTVMNGKGKQMVSFSK